MPSKLIALFTCVALLFNLLFVNAVYPAPARAAGSTVAEQANPLDQLKTQLMPQLEKILTPDQLDQLSTSIEGGMNPRKAFKSIALTPEQKKEVGLMLKSAPKDFFTSLTPEQKKQLFMKKRDLFGAKTTTGAE